MTSSAATPGPGGFFQPSLPSPPPSSTHSASTAPTTLPQSRNTPLKPGSAKESSFIKYVDKKLLGVSRKYAKRFNLGSENETTPDIEGRGYESFREAAQDLNGVIDIVWVSGTPPLQISYFLNIALTTCTYLTSFPFSPHATFHLLHKLDLALYSLLQGKNAETGQILPGFEGGRGKLSTTEKVRVRGLVEKTRVTIVEVAGKGGDVGDGESAPQTDDGFTTDNDDDVMQDLQVDGNHGRWEMEIARVYEKTIVELGMALDASGRGAFD